MRWQSSKTGNSGCWLWSFAQDIWNADVVLSKCSMLGQDSTLSSLDYRAEVPVQVHCLWRKMWSHRMWSWKPGENWKAECSSRTLVNKLFTPAALEALTTLDQADRSHFWVVVSCVPITLVTTQFLTCRPCCSAEFWPGPAATQQLPTFSASSIKFYDLWWPMDRQSKLPWSIWPDESTALVISRPKSGFPASLASLGQRWQS